MRQRYGHHFYKVGQAGLGALLLAFGLTAFALANGVHCPHCDAHALSQEQFALWERYFVVKDGVYGASAVLFAVASPLASPRRWPFVGGLAVALFAFSLTPM